MKFICSVCGDATLGIATPEPEPLCASVHNYWSRWNLSEIESAIPGLFVVRIKSLGASVMLGWSLFVVLGPF